MEAAFHTLVEVVGSWMGAAILAGIIGFGGYGIVILCERTARWWRRG
jgi:hypothetical protein